MKCTVTMTARLHAVCVLTVEAENAAEAHEQALAAAGSAEWQAFPPDEGDSVEVRSVEPA